jgi:hypothetical protein
LDGRGQRLTDHNALPHGDRRDFLTLHVGHDFARRFRRQTHSTANTGADDGADRPADYAANHRTTDSASGR